MLGLFRLRPPRSVTLLTAGVLVSVAVALGAVYLWSPHATLRITTGPAGGIAQRFIAAFVSTTMASHPRIRFETVVVNDLKASSKALEGGTVDIALVRSDVAPPVNGQTLVIIRRDVVAIVLPPGSPVKSVAQLSGKTVAIPQGRVQAENAHALDLILSYFNIPAEAVKKVFIPVSEIGAELHRKRAAAAFAVGPVGPGEAVDVVASIAKATRGSPEILALDEGDAISKRFPGFESVDVPEGGFKARPPAPSDTAKSVAVTYRFVVPVTMLDVVAGAIARSILKTKAKLMTVTPFAGQIEAPDPDENNPILPIHPGVAAYLASGDQSFFDEAQKYLYAVGIPLSILGSAAAIIAGFLRARRLEDDQKRIFRLLVIADEAIRATSPELEALEREFQTIVTTCVSNLVEGAGDANHGPASLAIEHARRAIEARKTALMAGPVPGGTGTAAAS